MITAFSCGPLASNDAADNAISNILYIGADNPNIPSIDAFMRAISEAFIMVVSKQPINEIE